MKTSGLGFGMTESDHQMAAQNGWNTMSSRFMCIAYSKTVQPGDSAAGVPVINSPTVYFTHEFLCYPSSGWSVDWDEVAQKAIEAVLNGAELTDNPLLYAGMIVKCHDPQRVWVLTGEFDQAGNGFQGQWPD